MTSPTEGKGLTITATMEGGSTTSRAYFSDKKNLWATGDKIGIKIQDDANISPASIPTTQPN